MPLLNSDFLAANNGFFEPQRTFSWSLEVALDDAGDQFLIVQGLESFDGFTESNDEIELQYANEKRYVAGQANYESSTLVLKDMVDIGVAEAMVRWRTQVYNPATGSIGLARDYKKNADLVLVAPDQSIFRTWKFQGIWPQQFKHGPFEMTTSDKVTVEAVLRFDKVIPGTGLGNNLGSINLGSVSIPL